MKESELRTVATCGICGEKIGKCGLPIFRRVRIETYVLDAAACQRQQGLGLMIGGALAQVMGEDADLAVESDSVEITVCGGCTDALYKILAATEAKAAKEQGK